jgi:hypothetical protein
MTKCKDTGKEIFTDKVLAYDIVGRNKEKMKFNSKKMKAKIRKSASDVYHCAFCGNWHIGTINSSYKNKQNDRTS